MPCELKVCTTKKPENPSVFLTLPVAHELSVLCMIQAFAPKGGKNVSGNPFLWMVSFGNGSDWNKPFQ